MTYPYSASTFGTALHRPECGQQRQLISNRRSASRAPAVYGPTTFGEISARNSCITGPTAVLKHSFGPNVFADARAHAIINAIGTYAPATSILTALPTPRPRTVSAPIRVVKRVPQITQSITQNFKLDDALHLHVPDSIFNQMRGG